MPENILHKNWWLLLLRGVVAILFSLVAIARPGVTLAVLIFAFGVFALIEGVLATISAIRASRSDRDWWVLLLEGLFGIMIGVITFLNPSVTALVLLFYIAAWAIVIGTLRVVEAVRLRHAIRGEFWMMLGGVASIAFGLLMLAFPGTGALAMVALIAAWAFVTGLVLVFLSLKLRRSETSEAESGGPQVQAPAH
jgi:uncharacterized membrane protein HdeD (DUF308 family)